MRTLAVLRTPQSLVAALSVAFLLSAANVSATGINLAWDDCGQAGKQVQDFACNTDSGQPFELVASFIPPAGINHYLGMSARIRVAAPELPDWWKVGTCRPSSAMTISFDASESCVSPWNGQSGGGFLYTIGGLGANTGRLLVQAANIAPTSLAAGSEYAAFRIHIRRARTAGADACDGCSSPVALALEQIQLFEPDGVGSNPVLTNPIVSATAYWQDPVGKAPTVSAFSPAGGAPGALVTVTGAGLANASLVRFGTVAAIASPLSDSQVRAFIPAYASIGPLQVETPFGAATTIQSFIPAPTLVYAIPPSAPVGTSVSLHGKGFVGATEVRFGGVTASFEVVSDSLVRAVVPAGATTGAVAISNAGGTGSLGSFQVGPMRGGINLSWNECADLGDDFATSACRNETESFRLIASFVPPAMLPEAKWIEGEIAVSAVALPDWWKHGVGQCRGTTAITVNADFAREKHCEVPLFWVGGGGSQYQLDYYGPNTARLRIQNVFAGAGVQLFADREYYGFKVIFNRKRYNEPCSGCEEPVSLMLRSVTIHQTPATGYDPVLTDPILRTVAYWQSVPGDDAGISGFAPAGGPSGTLVTLSGSGFMGTRSVRFGGIEAPFTVVSDATIQAMVPLSTSTAAISLTGLHGPHASEDLFFLPPEVLVVVPSEGFEGDEVTIQGDNLAGTTTVTFNGVPATFKVLGMNRIKATVPENATTGPIAVTNPGGAAIGDDFTVLKDTTPTLVSLARSEVSADRVRLAWDIPRAGSATLYRRQGMGSWIERARLTSNAEGRLEFEDADVTPGATYGYRLGLLIGRREIFGGDVTITMPSGISAAVELRSMEWSKGRLRATLSLPAAGAAMLEVFDLNGRRALVHRIEGVEAGERTAEWAAPGMAPGIYFARLTQSGGVAARRFLVTQ